MSLLSLHLCLPLAGIILLAYIKNNKGLYITHLLISFFSFLLAIKIFLEKDFYLQYSLNIFNIIPNISISFSVDGLGMVFLLVSNFLWLMTTIYSERYLSLNGFNNKSKFYIFFTLAMFSTNAIIYSSNLFTAFIFYEFLTLSTYPLVTFKKDEQSINNGKKYLYYLLGTSIIFLLPAIILTFNLTGTLEYKIGGIFAENVNPLMINILILLFIFGIAKSAIMPFHRWLPAAMVAPTPVSALLHAVAVVKSGVYIMMKIILYIFGAQLLQDTSSDLILIFLSSVTILFASIMALRQDNIKLILAYSTISQLSYIILAVSVLAPLSVLAAVLHLIFHALGKIILFLSAGLITTCTKIKNVSEMHGLSSKTPFAIFLIMLGAFIMIGIPPTIGFFSKWYLLLGVVQSENFYILLVLILSTLLNAGYYFPIIYKSCFSRTDVQSNENMKEDLLLLFPILIIGIVTILLFFGLEPIMNFIQIYIIK